MSRILSIHVAGLQVLSKLLPIVLAQLKSPHDLTRKKVRTTMESGSTTSASEGTLNDTLTASRC